MSKGGKYSGSKQSREGGIRSVGGEGDMQLKTRGSGKTPFSASHAGRGRKVGEVKPCLS